MNLYELCKQELKAGQVAYVDTLVPPFLVSIGAHMFNLVNKKKKVLYFHRVVRDTRLHVFMVAPSGFSKSFLQTQFVDEESGLLKGSQIYHGFESTTTEAGWVGTIKWNNGEEVVTPGLAEEYREGILACEEFSAIVEAMKSTHSRMLDTAILTSLDSGRVRKKLGAVHKICYDTNVTLWSGTQVARFDISSGMGRRLYFVVFFPTERDKMILKNARRRGLNVKLDETRTNKIGLCINEKMSELESLESVSFSGRIVQEFDKLGLTHIEEPLFENIAIGYNVMTKTITPHFHIDVDDELIRLWKLEHMWREQIKRGGQISQVLLIIKDHGNKIPLNVLRQKLTDFQLDWQQSSDLIFSLQKSKIVKIDSEGNVSIFGGL